MGFFGELLSSVVKVGLTPVAIVKDAVNVVTGEEPNTAQELLNSAVQDAQNATDSLCDGEL